MVKLTIYRDIQRWLLSLCRTSFNIRKSSHNRTSYTSFPLDFRRHADVCLLSLTVIYPWSMARKRSIDPNITRVRFEPSHII